MTIGQWIRRVTLTEVLTKWHLVESVIDDEPVTRCGRRLRARSGTALETSDVMPLTRMIGQPQLCQVCE